MRYPKTLAGLAIALVLVDPLAALADKIEGIVWDVDPLVVEGMAVVVSPSTKIERKHHPNIIEAEIRIGWEVKVEGESDGERFLARKIKVETERNDDIDVEGYIESVSEYTFDVEGRPVRWAGVTKDDIHPGLLFKGKGVLLDDGSVELAKYEIQDALVDEGEQKFLALAASELEEMKRGLDFYEDRLFQEYVARVGHGLVPEWVDRNALSFNFSIINDPDLNAFALPDGTIVVHTGILATLENEDQLATVLGHEIAHVVHKHGYRGYRRAQKMQWFAVGAAIAGAAIDADREAWEGPSWASTLVQLGATLSLSAAVNGHGRNQEDDADRIGLNYAIDAGYDPFEAPRVWYLFDQHLGDQDAVSNWFFSNHSTHQARISNLTQEINRYHRGHLDPEILNRNEAEYGRMVARLRRHNAVLDYERREYRNAEKAFRRILEIQPGDATSHLYLGKILWDTRGMAGADDALAELDAAILLDATLADPYREKGFVYYSLGYRESAVEAFERYVDLAPTAEDAAEVRGYIRDLSL